MSVESAKSRAEKLCHDAESALDSAKVASALELVREALTLDPLSARAGHLLVRINAGGDVDVSKRLVTCVAKYIDTQQELDGREALAQLGRMRSQISEEQASDCIIRMLRRKHKLATPIDDELTAAILAASPAARQVVLERFDTQPTETFRIFWHLGTESYERLVAIIVDTDPGRAERSRCKAIASAFQLALAHVIDAGGDHVDRALKTVSVLIANHDDCLTDLLDYDVFDILLPWLDLRAPESVRTQAMFSVVTLLKITTEAGGKHVQDFVMDRIKKQRREDLIVAFSAAAAIFPVAPSTMAALLLVDGFLPSLMPSLRRNSDGQSEHRTQALELAAIKFFGSACIDGTCREAVRKHCAEWLGTVAQSSTQSPNVAAAALVLTKLGDQAGQPAVSNAATDPLGLARGFVRTLVNSSPASSPEALKSAVEGLAYCSLKPAVKHFLIEGPSALAVMAELLKDDSTDKPSVFGVLTILKNVTEYRRVESEEQKKLRQLRALADADKPKDVDPLESDENVCVRCLAVLRSGCVAPIVQKRLDESPAAQGLIAQIINSLAKEQKQRAQLAQQGAVRAMVYLQSKLECNTTAGTSPISPTSRVASHALARILISVNPNHVFSSSTPAASALRPLLGLMSCDPSGAGDGDGDGDLLPKFEAMLALTNLASMHETGIREAIIRSAWSQIEELLLHSNTMVQRATVELICNLMASPQCVAKFADGNKQSCSRLRILLALTDAEHVATRKAAGGAVAMLTEWDVAIQVVLDDDKGVEMILGMCEDDDDEMKHRGVVCMTNLVSAPGDTGGRAADAIGKAGGAQIIRGAIQKATVSEVRRLGLALLKKLA